MNSTYRQRFTAFRARPISDPSGGGLMYDTFPAPGDAAISVRDGRAVVGRWKAIPGGVVAFDAASNWRELEEDAGSAVYDAGGALNWSGIYPCPPEIAARAAWEAEKEEA